MIHRWLLRHPRFHVHFTPTGTSWLNLVERWFALRIDKQITRGAHRTLVAREYERKGYVCSTLVRLFRKPGRGSHGTYGVQTRLVEALLSESTGVVPQAKYLKRYASGLRLKNPDLVGFHFGLNRWVFSEVKREHDRLHPQQTAALLFLREVLPPERAEVFVAEVRAK